MITLPLAALREYLRDTSLSQTDNDIRREALRTLHRLVGNQVYVQTAPRDKGHRFTMPNQGGHTESVLVLSRTSTQRQQGLNTESCLVRIFVDVTAYCRKGPSALVAEMISESARRALSTYVGQWRYLDENKQPQTLNVHDCVCDDDDTASFTGQAGNDWYTSHSFNVSILYEQITPSLYEAGNA